MLFQYRKLELSESVWKWILSNLTKFQLIQFIPINVIFIFCIDCLIELKWFLFHEKLFQTDAESFSSQSWKTKKFYSQKKFLLSHCQYQNKKILFTDSIFSGGFGRKSLEGHFLGQMEAANSFDKYNKAKGEHNSRISRSAMNF